MNQFHGESAQGLMYEDMLPLQWRAAEREATPLETAKLAGANEEVLRFIDVLDDYPSDVNANEHPPLNQELTKIEVKFDLLLSLVNQLIGLYFPLPPAAQVKLSPAGVQWLSVDALEVGSYGLVEVYLSLRCPRPLVFPVRLTHAEAAVGGYQINAQFSELSATFQERLEKIIFRRHRRSVALARRRSAADTKSPSA